MVEISQSRMKCAPQILSGVKVANFKGHLTLVQMNLPQNSNLEKINFQKISFCSMIKNSLLEKPERNKPSLFSRSLPKIAPPTRNKQSPLI